MFINYHNGWGTWQVAETEKLTLNLDVVDLGKMDLLVEQGFYSNRTDLMKTAIRNELLKHEQTVQTIIVKKSYTLGAIILTKNDLEQLAEKGEKIDLRIIGLLKITDDVSVELAQRTIERIKIKGAFKAPAHIKALYN